MPKTIDISTISDWDELDDYEKSQIVAELRKKGDNIVGLDKKTMEQLSVLGGYPGDLPDVSRPAVNMEKSNVPAAVEYGSSFLGGVVPGAKTGAVLGGIPGAIAGGLAGGTLAAGANLAANKLFNREPVAGSGSNLVNAVSGAIPLGSGIKAGMLRSGLEGAVSNTLDRLGGDKSASPLGGAIAGAAGAGLVSGALKPFGERTRRVLNEKDLTDWLRAKMGKGSAIDIGQQAQEVLESAELPKQSYAEWAFDGGKRDKILGEIRDRTGFDPLALTKADQKVLQSMAGKTNDAMFNEILAPIFSAKNTDELPKAAESVRKGIDSFARATGKSREEFYKGLRKSFVQNVLGDEDILTRPDSFRYRLEALGPDVVNALFSSAGKKGERSGAYHALLNMAEAASGSSGHFKVLLNPNGITILQHAPVVGRVMERLGLPKNQSFKLDSEQKFEYPQRLAEMIGIGGTALAHPGAGLAAAGAGGVREGLRMMHFSWEKAIEKFAARSNRGSDILKVLASGEQRFSRPMINNFMASLAKDADETIEY